MLDKNAKIEQFVYTAGGRLGSGGSFDVWSKSAGVDRSEVKSSTGLSKICLRIAKGALDEVLGVPYKTDQLKPDAQPYGIKKNKYRDEDYVYQTPVLDPGITELGGSGNASTPLKEQCPIDADFRANPDQAPWRIGACKLPDGRLLVARVTHVKRVFSEHDTRSGNDFAHAYIFPQGTTIEDVDVKKLNFMKTLDRQYWSEDKQPPELPQLTMAEIEANASQKQGQGQTPAQNPAQQTSQTKVEPQTANSEPKLTTEELLSVYMRSLSDNPDRKDRVEAQSQISRLLERGTRVPELMAYLQTQKVQRLKAHQPIDGIEDLLINLEGENYEFMGLNYAMREYVAISDSYEMSEEVNPVMRGKIKKNVDVAKTQIQNLIERIGVKEVFKAANDQRAYLRARADEKAIQTGSLMAYEFSTEYRATDMLSRATSQMLYMGKTFSQQTGIK